MKHLVGVILILSVLGCTKERIFQRPSTTTPLWTIVQNDTSVCFSGNNIRLINGLLQTTDSVNWFLWKEAANAWLDIGSTDSLNHSLQYENTYPDSATVRLQRFVSGDTDIITISLYQCFQSYYIPHAFSPDGDGENDLWFPVFYNPNNLFWTIRSDQGEIIFKNNGSLNAKWDGQWKGSPAPTGMYQYQITCSTVYLSETLEFEGWLQLYRTE